MPAPHGNSSRVIKEAVNGAHQAGQYPVKSDGGVVMHDNKDGRLRGRRLQETRLRIWADDPHCAMCRSLVEYPHGFELDHKQAIHKAGSNDDDNLQVLCPPCHASKTAKDMGHTERAQFDSSGRVVW